MTTSIWIRKRAGEIRALKYEVRDFIYILVIAFVQQVTLLHLFYKTSYIRPII